MSGLHLTARTVTDVITHLPVSMQPVESTVDAFKVLVTPRWPAIG